MKFSKRLKWTLLLVAFFLGTSFVERAAGEGPDGEEVEEVRVDDDEDSGEEGDADGEGQAKAPLEEVNYQTPQLTEDKAFLYESFDDEATFNTNWIQSKATKAESTDMLYDGEWALTESSNRIKGDGALLLKSRARHHAIGAKLSRPFRFKEESLVLQYEVQFRNGQECGGAYIKLLASPSGDLNKLNDKTPYSIMFGPDKCGNDHKLHFIFMHRNPKNGSLREIHWKKATTVSKLEEAVKDSKWHLFRLTIRPDNSFEVQMDKRVVGKGSLLEEFSPSVNPPKEIDDPHDSKPEDWDEREKVADPDAKKPQDWDESEPRKISDPMAIKPADWDDEEPEMVPDPDASKPSDWDPEMDGEWEAPLISNPKCAKISGCGPWGAPLIDNPKYRGKWKPPMISNPNFKGRWAPRKMPNPDFFEDTNPYKMQSIDSLAFELWTISDEIAFDNVLLTNDVDVANYILDTTFQLKKDLADSETDGMFVKLIKYTNKRPWLWAVYVLVIALPVVLFIAFCCVQPIKGGRKEEEEEEDDSARRKKTDEPEPDDEVREEAMFGISGDSVAPMRAEPMRSQVRIEEVIEEPEPEPELEIEEIEPEAESVEVEVKTLQKQPEPEEEEEEVEEQEEEEEEEEVEEESEPAPRTSPRLRKLRPRKDN